MPTGTGSATRFVLYTGLLSLIVGVGNAYVVHAAKITSILGHLMAVILYYRVKSYIDNSYTSYTSENEFGYSNIEKAQFRAENKRISRILVARGFVGWGLYYLMANFVLPLSSAALDPYATMPIWITSFLGFETMVSNSIYIKCFWQPNAKKQPRGIPRSQSGRLI